LKDKVVVPMLLPQGVNYKLEYAKPANFNVVGSHPLKTGAKHGDDFILDLMVMMPQVSFTVVFITLGVLANGIRICSRKKITSTTDIFTSELFILLV
jgi:hypothetical protein